MSYKTYTTEAFVCGSFIVNTSDKSYLLFTKEAGMLFATAKSVREERSKQRAALQDFSHLKVTLVKGKSGWKVGSAEALGNPFLRASSRSERALVHHVFREMRTYVHGEAPLHTTFSDINTVMSELHKASDTHEALGQLFSLRLLYTLGYIALEAQLEPLLGVENIREALHGYTEGNSVYIKKLIETAKSASQLS